jgi:hypothetical protein
MRPGALDEPVIDHDDVRAGATDRARDVPARAGRADERDAGKAFEQEREGVTRRALSVYEQHPHPGSIGTSAPRAHP